MTPERYFPKLTNKKQQNIVRSIISQKRKRKQIQRANEILAKRRVSAIEIAAREQQEAQPAKQTTAKKQQTTVSEQQTITLKQPKEDISRQQVLLAMLEIIDQPLEPPIDIQENIEPISEQAVVAVEPVIQIPEIHSPQSPDAESLIEIELELDSPPGIQGSLTLNNATQEDLQVGDLSDSQLNVLAFCSTTNDRDFMMNPTNAKIKYSRVQTSNTITLGAHTATILQYQDIADTEEFRSKDMDNPRYCFIKALKMLKILYSLFPGHKQGYNIPILNQNGELIAHKKQSQTFPQGYKHLPSSYTRTRSKTWTLSTKPEIEPKPGHYHVETNTVPVVSTPLPKKPKRGWDSYSKFLPPIATRPEL